MWDAGLHHRTGGWVAEAPALVTPLILLILDRRSCFPAPEMGRSVATSFSPMSLYGLGSKLVVMVVSLQLG